MARERVSFRTKSGRRVTFTAKRKKRSKTAAEKPVGFCKKVKNPRTGKTVWLCKTGRGKTGWKFRKTAMKSSGGSKRKTGRKRR